MNPLVGLAATTITIAFIFYTIGVFSERHAGHLAKKHIVLFWMGFLFDTTGTTIMTTIAQSAGGPSSSLHATSGTLAILLMLFHAIWATWVFARGNRKAAANFQHFSIVVWLIWLIPYLSGMFEGLPMLHLDVAQNLCLSTAIPVLLAIVFCLQSNWKKHHMNS